MIISLKKRRTIILVTHDMEQAKRVSDNLICICDGKLYDTGTFAERFENPEKENIPQCNESSTSATDRQTSFESLEFYKKPPE